jgi:hypothetical protein
MEPPDREHARTLQPTAIRVCRATGSATPVANTRTRKCLRSVPLSRPAAVQTARQPSRPSAFSCVLLASASSSAAPPAGPMPGLRAAAVLRRLRAARPARVPPARPGRSRRRRAAAGVQRRKDVPRARCSVLGGGLHCAGVACMQTWTVSSTGASAGRRVSPPTPRCAALGRAFCARARVQCVARLLQRARPRLAVAATLQLSECATSPRQRRCSCVLRGLFVPLRRASAPLEVPRPRARGGAQPKARRATLRARLMRTVRPRA